jgi:tetratricopeptide (TPR) repeat protein
MPTMASPRSLFVSLLVLAVAPHGNAQAAPPCPLRKPEAIQLANDADAMRKVDVDAAIAKYEASLALDPTDHRVLAKLGYALLAKEAWGRAAEAFQKAASLAPSFATHVMNAGHARVQEGRLVEARELLERAIVLDANLYEAHFELAMLALRLHDRPRYERRAAELLTRAIGLRPDAPEAYLALGDLYFRLRRYAEAKDLLEVGLGAVKAGTFELASLLGAVEDERGFPDAATARFEAAKHACGACTAGPQVDIFYNLGMAYATARPPRAAEASAQLQAFQRLACRGTPKTPREEFCVTAQAWLEKLAKRP